MDRFLGELHEEIAVALLEIPEGAPPTYPERRNIIVADALLAVARDGAHPRDAMEGMITNLEKAAQPEPVARRTPLKVVG